MRVAKDESSFDLAALNFDAITGPGRADIVLKGTDGDDRLRGGDGSDRLIGRGGDDRLEGRDGDDVIKGGAGNDRVQGGDGDDRMTGGAGNDVFFFDNNDGRDRIGDFTDGDKIRFQLDNPGEPGPTQFSDLTITDTADGALITYNPGATILLVGVAAATVTEADFIFG